MRSKGERRKKIKTIKKHVYNYSYMHSRGERRKKKRKQIRNTCTIARTRVPRRREGKKTENK
jgi:hypothetical protein